MLRRKILASAMASVMALTSTAVVAFADDEATDVKNVKSKADLETYVKSFDSFRENELNDYGSIAGERFLAAIEYADRVLEDSASTVDDYTVAYKMLEECQSKLRIYTSAELKTLVDSSVKTYETDNILNEDLGDLIYTEETFSDFASAFESAEAYVGSNDPRLITDCFEELTEAKKNLKANTTVTKAQFRSALKKYETMIGKLKSYDEWRKGDLPGWINLAHENYWMTDNKRTGTFGELIWLVRDSGVWNGVNLFQSPYTHEMVDFSDSSFNYDAAWVFVTVNGVSKQLPALTAEERAGDVVMGDNNWAAVPTIVGVEEGKSLQSWIDEQYNALNEIKTATKTSQDDIVAAYNDCLDAVAVYDEWKADDTNRASKASVEKLLNTYHANLVAAYNTTAAADKYLEISGKAAPSDWTGDGKFGSASLNNDSGSKQTTTDLNGKSVTVGKGTDILKFVPVDSSMVTSNATLAWAMRVAEEYLSSAKIDELNMDGGLEIPDVLVGNDPENVNTVFGLDQTGAVATAKRSTAEWTLVYRYLKYALEDTFPSPDATYTKKQVSEMIEKAYDLAEVTGDAAVFANVHKGLVEARQAAIVWVREANKLKGYKDGDIVDGLTSTDVYKSMESAYKALDEKLAKYKYGYKEIYNKISEVCDLIDSGTLVANDELTGALKDTTYDLSILNSENVADEENEAFSGDREFLGYNRLFTDDNSATQSEKDLKAAYEKLLAEVNKQINPDAKPGDVNKDGAVNSIDAALILKAVADGTVETLDKAAADYSGDGVVNSIDAAAILKAVADGTV